VDAEVVAAEAVAVRILLLRLKPAFAALAAADPAVLVMAVAGNPNGLSL
jgi:hypothetical protein